MGSATARRRSKNAEFRGRNHKKHIMHKEVIILVPFALLVVPSPKAGLRPRPLTTCLVHAQLGRALRTARRLQGDTHLTTWTIFRRGRCRGGRSLLEPVCLLH